MRERNLGRSTAGPMQLDMFQSAVVRAYSRSANGQLTNEALYIEVSQTLGLSPHEMSAKTPVGSAGTPRSLIKRRIRWAQQTLKALGLLEPTGVRGQWRTPQRSEDMPADAPPGAKLVAFSTRLGVAVWARCESVFPAIGGCMEIAAIITSPPYLLARPRAYGNPATEREYVEFIVRSLEPLRRHLLPGGSLALNITNDSFEPGLPSRRTYRERLVLALCDELDLHKCDEVIWHKTSAAPGPYQWCSRTRQQLSASYEPIYIFTPDPKAWFADNRRVLQPHSDNHRKLIAAGGEQRTAVFSDGAYRLKPGAFGNATEGAILRNVWPVGHFDPAAVAMNAFAKARGLQPHGAPMPYTIAERLVRWLTRPGDLVVDLFAGRLTTAKAAEDNQRRWLATEAIWDHLVSGATRFGTQLQRGWIPGNIVVDDEGVLLR